MDLPDLTAHHLAQLIRQRKISAQEALEEVLARVAAVDGLPGRLTPGAAGADGEEKGVHAFITLTADRARRQAQAIDLRLAAREEVGPLAGVPFTVKDIFCVQGTPSTAASRLLSNFISPYTATAVARLEAAGGVMLGKVNLDEFAYGSSSCSSAFRPTPRNPWDLDRAPGGSSGGSAAAVAAGEGALSLGTDTAGSIRQPAAFCGTVGLKPTYGRVSRYGLIAFGSSLDCPGPLARCVTDAALALNAIAGPDPHDSTAAAAAPPDYLVGLEGSIRGLRIGLSPDYFRVTYPDPETGRLLQRPIDPDIEAAVLRAAGRLAELGADIVVDVPMPHTRFGIPAFFVISRVEAASNLHRFDGVKYGYRADLHTGDLEDLVRRTRGEGFGLQPKLRILMGMYVSVTEHGRQIYPRAQQARLRIRQDFEAVFDPQGEYRLDALLAPTTPTTAFPLEGSQGDSVLMQLSDQLTVPANHAGIPALTLPCGLDSQGLPVGLQLLGPDFSEPLLLRIGRAFEKTTAADRWRLVKPQALNALDREQGINTDDP